MEEFPKKLRMCPRESSQGTENEMLNHPKRRSQRTIGLLKIGDHHLPRKRIPVGSSFQADVPEWTGPLIINKQCSDDKEDDDLKWLGTHVWPAKEGGTETNERNIGTGRTGFCHCTFPGSVECIIIHVKSARFQLRSDLGSAFHDWGFDEMGEEVSKSWTSEEQANFDDIVRLNPLSEGKSFLEPASKSFTSKSKKDIVSYYFNVYVSKRMSNQTRVLSETIDSDDDEGSSKAYSLERCVYVPVTEVSYSIFSENRKMSDCLSLYSKKILGVGSAPPVAKQELQVPNHKKRRICSRKSPQGTENEMFNQPKRRSQSTLGLLKNGDCHLPRNRISVGPSFQADVLDWTRSPSINKQCSDDKEEEESPLSSEEGYGEQKKEDGDPDFWWDDKDKAFAFRYNRDESYIPRQAVSEVPCAILDSLFSDVNRKTLDRYTDEDLIRLQNQMSFGSAMVAKYISDITPSRQCSLEVNERGNKKLRQNNNRLLKLNCERDNALLMLKTKKNEARELELAIKVFGERIKQLEATSESSACRTKKIEELLAKSRAETDKLIVGKSKKNEEVRELELAINAYGERIKQLEATVESSAGQTERLEKQLAVFRAEADKLRAENKLLKREIIPEPMLTAGELLERFKKTQEYMDDVFECGRQGFDFFKSAFLRRSFDSVAQVKKTVEELTHEEVCEEELALEGV